MARPENAPAPQLSEAAIQAINAAGGVSENAAQLCVHEEMNHIGVTLVGTANAEGSHGLVMFCDMPM